MGRTLTLVCLVAFALLLSLGIYAVSAQAETSEPGSEDLFDQDVLSRREVEPPSEETHPNVRQPLATGGRATAADTRRSLLRSARDASPGQAALSWEEVQTYLESLRQRAASQQSDPSRIPTPGSAVLEPRFTDYEIALKSRRFTPNAGAVPRQLGQAGRIHAIVQFWDIPREGEVSALKNEGIEILNYLPSFAYFAGLPAGRIGALSDHPNVRAIVGILPEDKLSPYIREGRIFDYVRTGTDEVRLTVVFFGDVSREEAIDISQRYGKVNDAPTTCNIFALTVPEALVSALAEEDAVQWIEPAPPEKEMQLDEARVTTNVDIVQAAPYDLDGTGVVTAMWDGGWVDDTHDDFAGRLTIGDAAGATHWHSTHVGGIMAGDGDLSGGTFRGFATNADIRSYEWPDSISELDDETTDAITNGAFLSQNSWSYAIEAARGNCDLHGDYDAWSQRYDQIINGALGDEISVVCSSANEEDDGDCPPYPWNQVNAPIATAKNSIAVGAVYSDTETHTCFSSRGPTDDGRLKPDLVAPGDEALDDPDSCLTGDMIRSTMPGDTYGNAGGTSMSTPMVSGTIALLRQQLDALGYGERKPHTFKAILVQTAEDLGNPGPDYTYGHGMLNAQAAVDLVIDNYPNNELVRTGSVIDDEVDTYYMSVPPGTGALRVTLAWDDIEGTPGAANELVNDLDLYLVSPSSANHYAYLLDPSNPENAATRTWNPRDNVEVVEVTAPEAGKWEVKVWGWIVTGTENYTVALPFEDINCGDYLYHDTELAHDLNCTGDGLNLNADNITLDGNGYTIRGDGGTGDYGVWIASNHGNQLMDLRIANFQYGVYLSNADSCTIGGLAYIDSNETGIGLLTGSDDNLMGLNYVYDNQEKGIVFDSSDNNTQMWSYIYNNKRSIYLTNGADYNAVVTNHIYDNSFYAILGGGSTTNDNYFLDNDIYGNNYGIRFYDTGSGNDIKENRIYDNDYGIYLYGTPSDSIVENRITGNTNYGIYVSSTSTDNVLDRNYVCTNTTDIHGAPTTSGDGDTCTVVTGYADYGQTSGCDWKCSGCRQPEDDVLITTDITLCPGTYNIPDVGGEWGVLHFDASGVTLDCAGATLIGDSTRIGIYSIGQDSLTITNCHMRGYDTGLQLTQSADNNLVEYSSFNDNVSYGVRVYNSDGNEFSENEIRNNERGIYFASATSNNNTLYNNVICDNSLYDIDDEDTNLGDGNTCETTNNYADAGQTSGCDIACSGCVHPENDMIVTDDITLCPGTYNIPDTGEQGVIRTGNHGVTIDGNGAVLVGDGSGYGIRVHDTHNVTVSNCTVQNYAYGIYAGYSDNVLLSNNTCESNTASGIWLYEAEDGDVIGNTSTDNTNYGLSLGNSHGHAISGNTLTYNARGIQAGGSDSNYVFDNHICDNTAYDIYVAGTSAGNSGDENACHTIFGWNDGGQTAGCDWECSGCRNIEQDLPVWKDTRLCPGIYNFDDTGDFGIIRMVADSVTLDCANARLVGLGDGYGIFADGHHHVSIDSCDVRQYKHGIYVGGSNFFTLTANHLEGNANNGVYLWQSDHGTLIDNEALSNGAYGFSVGQSHSNLFVGNEARTGSRGFYLTGSDSNEVTQSTLENNAYGVYVFDSDQTTVWNNDFLGSTTDNAYEQGTGYTEWSLSDTGNYWNDLVSNPGCPCSYEIPGPGVGVDDYATGPGLDNVLCLRGYADNGRGVAWGDYDGDEDLDLYIVNHGAVNRLLKNEGGVWVDGTSGPIGDSGSGTGAVWGDYDNDGDLDLYLTNYGEANKLFRNDGGTWTDATSGPLGDTGNALCTAWGDYDGDGDIDLYIANVGSANKLLRNDGGTWTDVSASPIDDAGSGTGVAWGDYDGDGDLDLYLANYGEANKLFRNDGGTWTDVTAAPLDDTSNGMGVAWGDYDNDGDLDLYVANYGQANKLFRNDAGTWTDATVSPLDDAFNGSGPAWADYDNDGDLDLYLTNNAHANKLFRNDGASWTAVTDCPFGDQGQSKGAAWGDYDGDGLLDLAMVNREDRAWLWRNDTGGNHWLQVKLIGVASNVSGIGMRVRIHAGGAWQMREISGGSGYLSQNSLTAEFGLGAATMVDTLEVRWGPGCCQYGYDISADQLIVAVEPDFSGVEDLAEDMLPPSHELRSSYPNPFGTVTVIRYGLPHEDRVQLNVYDALGRRVHTLVDMDDHPAGRFVAHWDGRNQAGQRVAPGVYFYRMETRTCSKTQRVVVLR